MADRDVPAVMFGSGGEGTHALEESVSLADTDVVAPALTGIAARLCA